MDSFQFIKDRIPDFPGYADVRARRYADEMVRARVGEALAALVERLGVSGSQPLDDVSMRAQFANQAAAGWFDDVPREPTAMADADRQTLAVVDRAAEVDASGLPDFVADLAGALGARDRAMLTAAPTPGPSAHGRR